MSSSYASLYGIEFPIGGDVEVGDIVVTGFNSYPTFQVITIIDDKAWIREADRGYDHIISVARLRKI